MAQHTIEQALQALRRGKMIILVDDEDRENEGDLVIAAQHATTKAVNFMIRNAGGLICVSLPESRARELDLAPMVRQNTDTYRTNFTISVDAASTTTGISALDRSRTIRALADVKSTAKHFHRPGHIFPLIARDGGVLVRAGHTEGSLDLVRFADLRPAAVICEVLLPDGSMARRPQLARMSKEYGIPLVSISQLIAWRRAQEKLVERQVSTMLETAYGNFTIMVYRDTVEGKEHVALVKGKPSARTPTLVRVHSECLTGDAFHSLYCDCGPQLDEALRQIGAASAGVLVYMRQEGRGIGLINKIKAYELQRKGYDTIQANKKLGFPPDLRDYGIGAQILRDIGVRKIILLTNNPKKVVGLSAYNLEIFKTKRLVFPLTTKRGKAYMQTKRKKMGHLV